MTAIPSLARFSFSAMLALVFALALTASPAWAEGTATKEKKADTKKAPAKPPAAEKGDTISWERDLVAAMEAAKKADVPVMICINSKTVDGGRLEPAAKGLREVIYADPRVVGVSRNFICVFLTPSASSNDYGELRARFGIEGLIVSPQHIFADPTHDTKTPLLRKEYWSYGAEDRGILKLVSMMNAARTTFSQRRGGEGVVTPPPGGNKKDEKSPDAAKDPKADAPIAPENDEARIKWIQETIALIDTDAEEQRRKAIKTLILNDKEGDCITPLVELLPTLKKNPPAQVDLIRGLGRPNLELAVEPILPFLKHKNVDLRANAAVSLEYIGSVDAVKDLKKYAAKEKEENIANHMYRALGRCGAKDSKIRQFLAKRARASKSEIGSLGPIIGLAYFEGEPKAARAVEDLLQKVGPQSFGRRGGGRNSLKRTFLTWCLTEIQDKKSGKFIREKMLKPLEHAQSRWLGRITRFYEAAAKTCEGDKEAKGTVTAGVIRTAEFVGGVVLKDDARKGRSAPKFTPKADWEFKEDDGGGNPWGGRGGGGRGGGN